MASSAAVTTWVARDRWCSSGSFDSSNSEWARMMPSWLLRRWKSRRRSLASSGEDARDLLSVTVGTGCNAVAYADARATFDSRIVPSGERQSVSTKIRMLPPAVRTYSTLPAAIQL